MEVEDLLEADFRQITASEFAVVSLYNGWRFAFIAGRS